MARTDEWIESRPEYRQTVQTMTQDQQEESRNQQVRDRQASRTTLELETTDLVMWSNIIQTVCLLIIIYLLLND